jgi:hypothetical protein
MSARQLLPPVARNRIPQPFLANPVRLRDGRTVNVRPIRRSDADGVLEFYARLSPESRRSRFLTASSTKHRLDAERLAAAAGRYDCVLVATETESKPGKETLAAVAQLVGCRVDAEAALVVRDDYQCVGLGSVLFDQLLQMGDQRGLRNVEATVLSGNSRILRILRQHHAKLGPADGGITQATIRLAS